MWTLAHTSLAVFAMRYHRYTVRWMIRWTSDKKDFSTPVECHVLPPRLEPLCPFSFRWCTLRTSNELRPVVHLKSVTRVAWSIFARFHFCHGCQLLRKLDLSQSNRLCSMHTIFFCVSYRHKRIKMNCFTETKLVSSLILLCVKLSFAWQTMIPTWLKLSKRWQQDFERTGVAVLYYFCEDFCHKRVIEPWSAPFALNRFSLLRTICKHMFFGSIGKIRCRPSSTSVPCARRLLCHMVLWKNIKKLVDFKHVIADKMKSVVSSYFKICKYLLRTSNSCRFLWLQRKSVQCHFYIFSSAWAANQGWFGHENKNKLMI